MTGTGPGEQETGASRLGSRRTVGLATGVFLALAVVAVVVAIRGEWAAWTALEDDTRAYAWRVSVPLLVVALACATAALLASAGLWAAMFRSAGGRTGWREAMAAWLGSNLGRYLPGKVWQLASVAAYVRARGDSGATALAVSLALQAVVLAAGAAVAVVSLGGRAFGAASPWTIAIAVAAIALALNPAILRRSIVWGRHLLRETPTDEAPGLHYGVLLRAGACAFLLWGLYGVGFWVLCTGLVEGSPVSLPIATGVYAAGYIIGYVVLLAPGGIVVREGAIAALLGAAAGVPLGPAMAIALAARLWTTVAELFAFALAAGAGLRRRPESR